MFKLASYCAAAAMVAAPIAASAQDYSRHQMAMNQDRQIDRAAPEGANATFNFRKTFGGKKEELDSSFGVTMAFGKQMGPAELDGTKDVRMFKVMDLRFDGQGARNFDLAGAQMTDFGRDRDDELRLQLGEGGSGAVIMGVAMLAGLGLALVVISSSDDE